MKKKFFPILVIAAIVLVACSQGNEGTILDETNATAAIEGQEAVDPADENAAPQADPFTNTYEPCKPFSIMDQILVTPFPGLPPVADDDLVIGPDDAVVTFLEYSQLTCPACASFEPLLVAIQERYPDDVRLVFRHFPFQDKSIITAQALEAAWKQGKFNEFKTYMFDRKTKSAENPEHANLPDDAFWGSVAERDLDVWLEEHIVELGLEPTQFFVDMYSPETVVKVQTSLDTAQNIGITSTPTLFINGFEWSDERTFEIFSYYVQLIMNQENEYDVCPPETIQPGIDYSATISTTKGDIVVDLFEDIASYTVRSFVFLAQEGWYDGLSFIAADDYVLSGDASDTGFGGPGYSYLDEMSTDQSFVVAGKLATINRGPGYNGSTFFINKITLENNQSGTIFGEVIEGMDVVNALEQRDNIIKPAIDRILSVTIHEK